MDSLLYNYKHGFSGFAARLTEEQAKHILGFPGVVGVIPNTIHKLHTTRSWDFLDLNSPPPMNHSSDVNMGDGAIIGVIDTGIWPESPSFRDEDMGPIPSRWKGICQEGEHFNHTNCNKKIIGARWFIKGLLALMEGKRINTTESGEFLSPRSAYGYGHGTHTASTAAGRLVHNASYKGLGTGLARGGAPLAHLAIYKSCWHLYGCATADILKAFDEAIHDGVDVLSVSLNSPSEPHSYIDQRDAVNIGSFHAVAKGITVVCSGGNSGPSAGTVKNTAPWIINVAATTIDRSFPAPVTLGNNRTYMGQSLSSGKSKGRRAALVFAGDVGMDGIQSGYCEFLFLNSSLTAGKVVLCFSLEGGSYPSYAVADAGGVGVIIVENPTNSLTPCKNVTCVSVDYEIGAQILSYIQSSRSPSVKLNPAKSAVGMSLSTKVAYFSARGPSPFSPAFLKVCGKDKRGRVRGLGAGVSKTSLCYSAPYQSRLDKVECELFTVAQKLEMVIDKQNSSTQPTMGSSSHFEAGYSPQERHNSSVPDVRPVPTPSPSPCMSNNTRCHLKNFLMTRSFASGLLLAQAELADPDYYEICIEEIFDITAVIQDRNLPEGSTFANVCIGEVLRWPKNMISFIL